MSYRGTPYYSMARDAGCRHGDEAEQMAAAIEADQRRQAEQQWQREAEERAAHEQALAGCDICSGAHTNAEHMASCDADGRYVPPSRESTDGK